MRVSFSVLEKVGMLILRSGPLLLLLEEGQERDVGDFDDLESDAWNVTDGVTGSTESRHQHFVVLLDVVQTTVLGTERSLH